MNKDTIYYIQQYSSDSDFLFKFSLINKDFYSYDRRNKIISSLNRNKILQVFSEDDHQNIYSEDNVNNENLVNTSNFDYLFEFLTSKTVTECLQWYANALLNFIPFHKYEIKHQYRMFKTRVYKYTSSNSLFSPVRIHHYPCRIHSVYKCRYLNYHQIKNNLTVKALIY